MRNQRKIWFYIIGIFLTLCITVPSFAETDEAAPAVFDKTPDIQQIPPAKESGSTDELESVFSGKLKLKKMIKSADFIFVGVVEKIEYVMSTPANIGQGRVPYTFVTYNVEEVLKGDASRRTATLQFIGGMDRETSRYMTTSVTPQFDLGDRDILFVQGNTHRICPLVGNKEGRLRIVKGKVFTESGRSIELGGNNDFLIGSLNRLDEVEKTVVDGHEFKTGYDPKVAGVTSNAVDMELVLEKLRSMSPRSPQVSGFMNANPSVVLEGPDMTPAAPPSR
ncbi:MAG: hypothetical protein DCC43_15570 [Candidatus Brocadia sp.]|nr:hypothetical protein [Anaerolineales bacterium]MCC6325268.1 hypothetical protein [Candidatus Brocadia sp.]MCE7913015.1 hypothetical protein [Candidatus Brocadia sp. AMX3]RIJ89118.1 MAG: hypothetical protein DCC43_15570 [Candidatus Brocadia sp.]